MLDESNFIRRKASIRTDLGRCCACFSSARSLDARAKPIIEGRLRHLFIPIFSRWAECRDFSVCQRACALIVRTTVRPFCAIWTPQCGGKRESCVYSSAKINLLFRIEEVFAKQFSDFLRTVVMIDKNKWTFFRMLSCFVSFSASFVGKPRVFFFSLRRRLLLACVGAPKRTRPCASRTHRSSHFLPSPFTFTRNVLKMGEIRVNFRVILTLRR